MVNDNSWYDCSALKVMESHHWHFDNNEVIHSPSLQEIDWIQS